MDAAITGQVMLRLFGPTVPIEAVVVLLDQDADKLERLEEIAVRTPLSFGPGRPATYPFERLRVGEFFDVENAGVRFNGRGRGYSTTRNRISAAACAWRKRNDPRSMFTVRVSKDKRIVRCTRIA